MQKIECPLLVLASASPYRRELLARLRLPFVTAAPNIDEAALPGEPPNAQAMRLACAKADAVRTVYPDALIIGSDQVAVIDGTVLGKPSTHAAAVRQLQSTRGKITWFLTALCLLNARTTRRQQCIVTAKVQMRDFDDGQIERYLAAERPYDCAGSAKIEGLGIALVKQLDCDDPSALIGLPLISLCDLLRNEGIALP
jgi:septum formation protein